MGFYELIKVLKYKGDEIILLGFANFSNGKCNYENACTIYSDLDENTYGSNYKSIKMHNKKQKL